MTGVLLSAALMMGFPQPTLTQPPPGLQVVEPKLPTHKDLKDTLKEFETWLTRIDDPEYYPEFEFKNASTGKIRKVSDLTPVERKAFFCMQGDNLERKLLRIGTEWGDLETFLAAEEAKPQEKEPEDDCGWFWGLFKPKSLSADDVKKYKEQLMALRPKAAAKHEALVEKMYKDHADVFTKDEAEAHIRTLRERHDSEKLIERPQK